MIRFNSYRRWPASRPGPLGYISKNIDDIIDVAIAYNDFIEDGDYLSALQVTGVLLSDRDTDKSSTILTSTAGTPIAGSASSGSTTTLVTTANQKLAGLLAGDKLLNTTQVWATIIKSFSTTTVLYDTLNFPTQSSAAASSDAWKTAVGTFQVKSGAADTSYLIETKATFNSGQVILDHLVLAVYATIEGTP